MHHLQSQRLGCGCQGPAGACCSSSSSPRVRWDSKAVTEMISRVAIEMECQAQHKDNRVQQQAIQLTNLTAKQDGEGKQPPPTIWTLARARDKEDSF
jgi:hypothetical protein